MSSIALGESLSMESISATPAPNVCSADGSVLARVIPEETCHRLIYSWLQSELEAANLLVRPEIEREHVIREKMKVVYSIIDPIPDPFQQKLGLLISRHILSDAELVAMSADDEDDDRTLTEIFAELNAR